VLNPLAIGVTAGGLLLDVIAPRPKPRAGVSFETSLLSNPSRFEDTVAVAARHEHERPPVVSG
jgi:hypothetical protein